MIAGRVSLSSFVALWMAFGPVHAMTLPILCGPGEFTCSNGGCIPLDWVCDGTVDCPAGYDELANCTSCAAYEFECGDQRQCILEDWRCDGQVDCKDYSDENNCTLRLQPVQQPCGHNEYKCDDGKCISINNLCDGKIDCHDKTDENGTCENFECSTNNGGCSHFCQNSPKGPLCGCPSGFILGPNGTICRDIDECTDGVDSCSQICANSIGNYTCECSTGYNVTVDGQGCVTQEYNLLFIVGQRLYIMASDSTQPSPLLPVPSTGGGMDYDYNTMTVYWADNLLQIIYKAHLQGLWSDVKIIVHGTGTVEGVAVDWVGKNLYWTDDEKDTIEVAKLSGEYRSTVINTGLDKPKDINLDPARGYMYWIDWGRVAKIERSHMDGQKREVLVSSKITWPSGLSLDLPNNRLYWTDGKRGKIESVTLTGSSRRTIFVGKWSHPFSVAVFGDHVFWTDSLTSQLEKADKRTGKDRAMLLHTGERITNVRIFHPLLRPPVSSPCEASNCPHLCLLSPSGYSCACADRSNSTDRHYCLQVDQSTTVPSTTSTQVSKHLKSPKTYQSHVTHKKKKKIHWNGTKSKAKKDKRGKNGTKGILPNYKRTNEIKDLGEQNDTNEFLCLHKICKSVGDCDAYLSMRSNKDSNTPMPIQTNCTCVERMRGKCGQIISEKSITRLSEFSAHWIFILIVFSLAAIAIALTTIIWKRIRNNFLRTTRATYNKESQRIAITSIPIEDVDFEDEDNGPIYNPTPGYINPLYAISDSGQSTPVFETAIVFEELQDTEEVGREYPHVGNFGQYSPISEDLVEENDNQCNEFHQFVNPVYVSPKD